MYLRIACFVLPFISVKLIKVELSREKVIICFLIFSQENYRSWEAINQQYNLSFHHHLVINFFFFLITLLKGFQGTHHCIEHIFFKRKR